MLPARAKTFVEMTTEALRAHVGAGLDLIGRRLAR
ncbi:hypothetical protein M2437_004963 [Methylorubrum pseudosasae]|nr:hypothetical protein [Methylorubrum pseudosasae]